jgi:hypothetical protein
VLLPQSNGSTTQEIIMALKFWLPGSVLVYALTTMAATAQAGPAAGAGQALKAAGPPGWSKAQVANRVCWTENGRRRCRSLDDSRVYGYQSPPAGGRQPVYGYQAAPPPGVYVGPPIGYGFLPDRDQIETDPDAFPVGTADWWHAMDTWDRGGQVAR